MNFRIADTFTSSLARLTNEEQKATKTTAFDLQMDPINPGMSLHKLDRARDPNFWSVRVGRDLRLIVHRTAGTFLLCYVDHHDKAYAWAERRRLETHPTTGAAQFVSVAERIEEVVAQVAERRPSYGAKARVFADIPDEELLAWGVPPSSIEAVRTIDDDNLLTIAATLPAEAAEALLVFATGGVPERRATHDGADPFEHPDAQRRFRIMEDAEALERAMDAPWDQWTVFLHPAQRQWVERSQSGPSRVSGSAGTGKTVVAVHRAVHLARTEPDARVLLTTFSPALAHALHTRMRRLAGKTPRLGERIDVASLDELGERLYRFAFGKPSLALEETVRRYLLDAAANAGDGLPAKFGPGFLWSEWNEVIDPWQITTWDHYRNIRRLGRKTRLSEAQRAAAWRVFSSVARRLEEEEILTLSGLFARLAAHYGAARSPYEHIVVDEAQDIGVQQLRFLAALGSGRANRLFFAGDLGQRIFQTPFSWKALGVDVRGRARTLHVNYRTSHQIRLQADRLLGPEVADVDGNVETRRGTVSTFNGPMPVVKAFDSAALEIEGVGRWLAECSISGVRPGEIGVFVRSEGQIPRATAAIDAAGLPHHVLDRYVDTDRDAVAIATMHLIKGLEFRAVAVMACDDEIVPLQERIDEVADEADLKEVYDTERQLLYVACTRARDRLLVTAAAPASEFLRDLSS